MFNPIKAVYHDPLYITIILIELPNSSFQQRASVLIAENNGDLKGLCSPACDKGPRAVWRQIEMRRGAQSRQTHLPLHTEERLISSTAHPSHPDSTGDSTYVYMHTAFTS